jgi:hypothetical protein
MRDDPNMYWVSEVDWLLGEVERLQAALDTEHEIQRVLLERLGIEWTPGEPFVALVEAEIERLTIDNRRLTEMWDADRETLTVEIERLRIELHRVAESRRGQRERAECAEAENGRLRAALELADEVARLLADEGSWHEEIAEEDSCEAGNFDGGTSRNCPHCHHQQRGQAIDALLTRWDTANKALDGPLIEPSEETNRG